jgi:hypothetical protein
MEGLMRIEDFPRPKADNRRGIHWSASIYHPVGSALDFWLAELQAMKIKWVKVLDDGGGSSLEVSQRLLAADIMPIVRVYRMEPNPGTINGREQDTIRRLVAAGVRYFETNNEPDLSAEWKGGKVPPNWPDIVVDNFIVDADIVLAAGGLPALPATAVGSKANLLELVIKRGRADLFEKGAWIAIHNYTLNHPLDYPYDPVNQQGQSVSQAEFDELGPWAWEGVPRDTINQWRASDKNPGDTIADDASCFLAFQAVDQFARQALGFPVPIISTEGGPVVGWKEDRRYPRVTPKLHSERVVAIAEYMQGTREIHGERCPSNYFTMCHWLLANYRIGFMAPGWESQAWYTDWWNKDFGLQGALPVVEALKALPGTIVEDHGDSAAITGKVQRADNDEALPGLTVQLLRGDTEVAKTQTDADGAFVFHTLASGAYDIAIMPWGLVRRGVNALAGGGQPVALRLAGGRGSVLSGTVQNSAGAIVAGVEVGLQRDGQLLARTASAANGAFRFEGLTLGLYRLAIPGITVDGIALDGWQAKSLKLTTGVASGYKYVVDKQRLLDPEETENRRLFYGVVVDALGKPLNGIKVRMSWTGAAPETNFPVKVTGHDPYKPVGYYEFLHTPGIFTLQVVQGDWPSDPADTLETANVPGREGQAVTYEVNFRLHATGGASHIDGVINGGKAGGKVTLTPVPASAGGPPARQAALAANGAFAFPSVAAASYQLALEGTGVICRNIVITAGALFKVLFAMRSRLSGKVLNAPEGLVAVLYAPASWGWTRQVPLARDGSFAFDNLPAGRYRLQVGGRVYTDLALTGENRLVLTPVDLYAGRRSVLRGRVADANGQPKGDRMVTLKLESVVAAQQRTAADGTYRFANLPAGKYNVEAAGLGVVGSNIALDGEREALADVIWPDKGPRGILLGRMMTESGAPRPFALVRLVQGESEVARTEADAKGDFKFTSLAAGTYEIAVGDDGPLIRGIAVGEDATVVHDIPAPGGPAKVLTHYVLLAPPSLPGEPGRDEAKVLLGLVAHCLTGEVAGGFNLEEAKVAKRVTIVGERVPASAEVALAAAGCEVTRLGGDAFAVAGALAHVFAEG